MRKLLYYVKNLIYFLIISTLGLTMFFGEPIGFFIAGVWALSVSIALYKNYTFLLSLLLADFDPEKQKMKGYRKQLIEVRFSLVFAIVMFILGVLVHIFPEFFIK